MSDLIRSVRWPCSSIFALYRIFADAYRANPDASDLTTQGRWIPPVDIFETDKHELVLMVEVPDVDRDDIRLKVENNTLTISGEKKMQTEAGRTVH